MSTTSNLRPLSIGELLDRAFRLYRAQFLTFTGIVALPLIPIALLQIWSLSSFGTSSLVSLAQGLVQLLISAAVVVAISEAYLWEPVSIGEAYRRGIHQYWGLFAASLLVGLAIGVPAVLISVCIGFAAMELAAFVILIIIVPAAAYLSTRWVMVTPVVVLEEEGARDGLRRSWHLTEGYFWRVFGTSVLAGVLTFILAQLPATGVTYLVGLTTSSELVVAVLSTAVSQLSLIITTPFSLAVTTLLYYDLRVRKEGYDLELQAEAIIASPADELSQ